METAIIPWMSKEETDRMVRELNEWAQARRAKAEAETTAAAPKTPAALPAHAPVSINVGGL